MTWLTTVAVGLTVVAPVLWLIAREWALLTGRDTLAEFADVHDALASRFELVDPEPVDYWDESKAAPERLRRYKDFASAEWGALLAVRLLCDVVASHRLRWEMRPEPDTVTVTVTLPLEDVAWRALCTSGPLADACRDALEAPR